MRQDLHKVGAEGMDEGAQSHAISPGGSEVYDVESSVAACVEHTLAPTQQAVAVYSLLCIHSTAKSCSKTLQECTIKMS